MSSSWFYGILHRFVERRDDPSLWGGAVGASLLAGILTTLAAIVECCGLQQGTSVLARDLIHLAWSFHDADVATLRRAVLFSVGTGLEWIRDENMLLSLLLDESSGLMAGVVRMTKDADENCREIALAITASVTANIQVIEQARPLLTES